MTVPKQPFVIDWTMHGTTTVFATDTRDAQRRFDKMDAQRLLRGRPISPYGHPDSTYRFDQNSDPRARNDIERAEMDEAAKVCPVFRTIVNGGN